MAATRDVEKARGAFTELGMEEGAASPDGQACTQGLKSVV